MDYVTNVRKYGKNKIAMLHFILLFWQPKLSFIIQEICDRLDRGIDQPGSINLDHNSTYFSISGLMLSAFSVKLWQFYGATALQFLKYTQWGLSQSLLSKCVSKDDIGKMYGVCGIISALIPFASNGILRFVHVFTILIIKFTLPDLTVLFLGLERGYQIENTKIHW